MRDLASTNGENGVILIRSPDVAFIHRRPFRREENVHQEDPSGKE